MAITDKQARNGIPAIGAVADPQPGPMPDVSGVLSQAVAAAESRKGEAAALMQSPQGSGVGGHQLGANGNMWEWDSGQAVTEQAGEA